MPKRWSNNPDRIQWWAAEKFAFSLLTIINTECALRRSLTHDNNPIPSCNYSFGASFHFNQIFCKETIQLFYRSGRIDSPSVLWVFLRLKTTIACCGDVGQNHKSICWWLEVAWCNAYQCPISTRIVRSSKIMQKHLLQCFFAYTLISKEKRKKMTQMLVFRKHKCMEDDIFFFFKTTMIEKKFLLQY